MLTDMRTESLHPSKLIKALGNPKPPEIIWQKPFDYMPGHCERIAHRGFEASLSDLNEYFDDYQYMDVQRDLFKFVLPIAVEAWAKNLLGSSHPFEIMFQAFDRRPPHPDYLTDKQFSALGDYMASILRQRMEMESKLSFRGSDASPYSWTEQLANLIYFFPVIESFWEDWFQVDEVWKAICGLQWWSGFLYDHNSSPIFGAYSREHGGGNICPFETSHLKYTCANSENAEYLNTSLNSDAARDIIHKCCNALQGTSHECVAEVMRLDLETQSETLDANIQNFLGLLSLEDGHRATFWSDIPALLKLHKNPDVIHLTED